MNTTIRQIVVPAILLAASAFATPALADIRLGHTNPATHNWQTALEGFAKEVSDRTEGRVDISLFSGGQLGSEKEMMEGMQLGTIPAALLSAGTFQSVEPRLAIVELPYIWDDSKKAYQAYDGELGEALSELLEPQGFIVVGWWENGLRHISTNDEPVLTPEDLKGLKIRVAQEQLRIDSFQLMGAEPGPLAYGEVYSALQQGLFDATEGPLSAAYASGFYEVQKSMSLTGHIWSPAALTFSAATWETFSREDQAAIREAAQKWGQEQRRLTTEADAEMVELLEEKGMAVVEVDRKPFAEAAQPVWDKYEPVFGEDLMAILRRARQ